MADSILDRDDEPADEEIVRELARMFSFSLDRIFDRLRRGQEITRPAGDADVDLTAPEIAELREGVVFASQLEMLVDQFLHGARSDDVTLTSWSSGLAGMARELKLETAGAILPEAVYVPGGA